MHSKIDNIALNLKTNVWKTEKKLLNFNDCMCVLLNIKLSYRNGLSSRNENLNAVSHIHLFIIGDKIVYSLQAQQMEKINRYIVQMKKRRCMDRVLSVYIHRHLGLLSTHTLTQSGDLFLLSVHINTISFSALWLLYHSQPQYTSVFMNE